MPSRSERNRNNVRAGIFVSLTILVLFAVVVVLSDLGKHFESRVPYRVRFSVINGVDGLAPGSPVKVGGLERGRVTLLLPELTDGRVTAMLAAFELDRDIQLFDNAKPERVTALIGSTSSINFTDVGNPDGGRELAAGGLIDATASESMMLRRLIGDEAASRFSSVVRNVDEVVAGIRADYEASVGPGLRRFDAALADAQEVIASVKRDYPQWSERVGSTLERIETASGRLDPLVSEGQALVGDLRSGVAEYRAVLGDNRARVDEIIENVRVVTGDAKAIAARVRGEMLDRVDAILARGQAGVDVFTATLERLQQEVELQAPRVDTILADTRLTAQQLKLASIEVRRSPWRLLYRPTDKELEHELLYEATRSFALAAGDLQSTSEGLDRVLSRHAEDLRADPAMVDRLRGLLEQSFKRYDEAQSRLFSILLEE